MRIVYPFKSIQKFINYILEFANPATYLFVAWPRNRLLRVYTAIANRFLILVRLVLV